MLLFGDLGRGPLWRRGCGGWPVATCRWPVQGCFWGGRGLARVHAVLCKSHDEAREDVVGVAYLFSGECCLGGAVVEPQAKRGHGGGGVTVGLGGTGGQVGP